MKSIPDIFKQLTIDDGRLHELEAIAAPRQQYLIAITPRSGSSYLCDVLKRCRRFGVPDEIINQQFIPSILKKIPGRSPDEYLRNVIRFRKTRNGISGFKASWFQFENFARAMTDSSSLLNFRYIYLTRQDHAAQAVSLFKATASTVFHTNLVHDANAMSKLESLEYNFAEIKKWYLHILKQEEGWQSYFRNNKIDPLLLTYEEIEEDILAVILKIASHVGVKPENVALPAAPSIFKKIGDDRNQVWASRFRQELGQQSNFVAPSEVVTLINE